MYASVNPCFALFLSSQILSQVLNYPSSVFANVSYISQSLHCWIFVSLSIHVFQYGPTHYYFSAVTCCLTFIYLVFWHTSSFLTRSFNLKFIISLSIDLCTLTNLSIGSFAKDGYERQRMRVFKVHTGWKRNLLVLKRCAILQDPTTLTSSTSLFQLFDLSWS